MGVFLRIKEKLCGCGNRKDVVVFLLDYLDKCGMFHRYKLMHMTRIQADYVVTHDTIRR